MSTEPKKNTNPDTDNNTNPDNTNPDEKKTIVYKGFGSRIIAWLDRPFREAVTPVKYHMERAAYHTERAEQILETTKGQDRMTKGSFMRGTATLFKRVVLISAAAFGAHSIISKFNNNDDNETLGIEDNTSNDDVIE